MESFYLDRPLNFAHRGASHEAPENTLAAFLLAAELGADGIELDVQLSKDGQVVVIHDFVLETTTDGQGAVQDRTLAELKELDAGSSFDPLFAGQRIPTLQEVIHSVGRHLLLNIELKTKSTRDARLARAVARIVEENHLLDRVVVSSFNPLALRQLRKLNPWIPLGLLYAPDMPRHLRRPWLRRLFRPEALHPHHSMVDAEYVSWAKAQNYRIHTWTVDDPGEMWQLMRQGVDIMITNRPDLLRQVLAPGSGEPQSPASRLLSASRSTGTQDV
ncbi:MAG: glycerophosphodiester phosphodiesterase family protein [Anaerolineae bacterium]|jgi:glycerophosphoryl diester phosphodiesterase